ncbi:MAG: transcription antitermination factor NusB [Pseudomonadota bacterium]
MGNRRQSREFAMQALFDMDMSRDSSDERFSLFCQNFDPPEKARPFFIKLYKGVVEHRADIDSMIDQFSSNWKIERISCVDRNVMRIAIYEMLYCDDIPAKVSINEAIDIGKRYGTDESGAFINGILDSIRKMIDQRK